MTAGGDIIIVTDASVHLKPSWSLELKRRRGSMSRLVERRGNFTSIVLLVDGLMHREAEHFLKRIAAYMAHKWEKPYMYILPNVWIC